MRPAKKSMRSAMFLQPVVMCRIKSSALHISRIIKFWNRNNIVSTVVRNGEISSFFPFRNSKFFL